MATDAVEGGSAVAAADEGLGEMGNASRHRGALGHLRICDLSGQLAGAGATRVLASFGAQVIRIEDPVTKGLWDIVRQIGPYVKNDNGPDGGSGFINHNVEKLG